VEESVEREESESEDEVDEELEEGQSGEEDSKEEEISMSDPDVKKKNQSSIQKRPKYVGLMNNLRLIRDVMMMMVGRHRRKFVLVEGSVFASLLLVSFVIFLKRKKKKMLI